MDKMGPVLKHSGLQKQVLDLYRKFLRAARAKTPEDRLRIESVVSAEFHRNATAVDRKNFMHIEYLLRRGKRQLDQLTHPDTVGLSTLEECTAAYESMLSSGIKQWISFIDDRGFTKEGHAMVVFKGGERSHGKSHDCTSGIFSTPMSQNL